MNDIPYNTFYLRYGVRQIDRLPQPRMFDIADWTLPKNILIHYIPQGPADIGPPPDFWATAGLPRQPYVAHTIEMTSFEGAPRKKGGIIPTNLMRSYVRTHRGYRRVPNLDRALVDIRYPVYMSYGIVPLPYRYTKTVYTRMYRFNNLMRTVYAQANELAKTSDRHQYFFFNVPKVIPVRARWNMATEDFGPDGTGAIVNVRESLTDFLGIGSATLFGDLPFDSEGGDGRIEQSNSRMAGFQSWSDWYGAHPNSSLEWHQILNDNPDLGMEAFDESSLGWGDINLEEAMLSMGSQGGGCPGCEDYGIEAISLEGWNRITLKFFPDDDAMRMADLFKWIGEKRKESLFGMIEDQYLDKINIVFLCGGKYSTLNMGKFNSWIKTASNPRGKKDATQVAIDFLKYMNALAANATLDPKDTIIETIPDEREEETQVLAVIPSGHEETSIVEEVNDEHDDDDKSQRMILGVAKAKTLLANDRSRDERVIDDSDEVFVPEEEEEVPTDIPHSVTLASTQVSDADEAIPDIDMNNPLEANFAKKSFALMQAGVISRAEHNRHRKLAQRYKSIKAPDGTTLDKYVELPKDVIWDFKPEAIKDIKGVTDKSMLRTTLRNFDRDYTTKVMDKEVARMVLNVQRGPAAITDYQVTETNNVMGRRRNYRVKIAPLYGKESTINFTLPVIDKNGKYKVNGVRYYQRKQRTDRPIRKISATTVALTTYYGKLFVDRSTKRVDDYGEWLVRGITADILSDKPSITDVVYGNGFTEEQPLPRAYTAIEQRYLNFKLKGTMWIFDYNHRFEYFSEQDWARLEKIKRVPVGKDLKGTKIYSMDFENRVWDGDKLIGPIEGILNLPLDKAPIEVVSMAVLGKPVPMGIVLAYYYGINGLVKRLGVEPVRRVKGARRPAEAEGMFDVVFQDEVWSFPKTMAKSTMIWASLLDWEKSLRTVQVADLNTRDNFFTLFTGNKLTARHLNELDNIEDYFIDPTARELLEEMKEPTEVAELFERAAELVVTDLYPSDLDSAGGLIKGYERMPGQVYRSFVDAMRQYRNKPMTNRASIDVNPYEVLSTIQEDPAVSLVEDSNPIRNLKEKEAMTYSGSGGRSKRAMVRRTRAFHKSDIGIRSEANIDSGDVGINQYLTYNPNITSLRGTVQGLDPNKADPAQMLSTTTLAMPFGTQDDPRRANFATIQADHVIAIEGNAVNPIQTGMGETLAHNTDDTFSFETAEAGKVIDITDKYLLVEYKSGRRDSCQLGKRFGNVTGHIVPHMVITDYKVGQRFEAGEIAAFNTGFFVRNRYDHTQVLWKTGALAWVMFAENNETFEDSSLIFEHFAPKMVTEVGHVTVAYANFTQVIHNVAQVGDEVDIDSVIAYVEDAEVAAIDSTASDRSLAKMGAPVTLAGVKGKIEHIEVIYYGDKDDMSESIRKIANKYDRQRADLAKVLGDDEPKSGEMIEPARVNGVNLELDMIAIRFYITHRVGMSGGDKQVYGNQLKSVISKVRQDTIRTEGPVWPRHGRVIVDAMASYRAMEARIVNSPYLMGLGGTSLLFVRDTMLDAYDS